MNRYLPVFVALAGSLVSSAFVPSLKASEFDKKTIITISQPIAVEDTILPAGQYVLRLLDTPTRDVVYIFNGEETRLIKTILAIHAERSEPTVVRATSRFMTHLRVSPPLCTPGSIRAMKPALSFYRLNTRPQETPIPLWVHQGKRRRGRVNLRTQQALVQVVTNQGTAKMDQVRCTVPICLSTEPHPFSAAPQAPFRTISSSL